METPPPYMPAPKKNNTGLIIGLVIGGIFLCCLLPIGLLAGGGLWAFNNSKGAVGCIVAFDDVRDATLAYAKDHSGKLPDAGKWMDQVRPYYEKEVAKTKQQGEGTDLFGLMPAAGAWGCDNGDGGKTGIAFNKDLSGKKVADIKNPETTFLIFEVAKPAENLAEAYKEQSKASSPKLMGNPRGWYKAAVSGDVDAGELGKSSANGEIKINSRSTK